MVSVQNLDLPPAALAHIAEALSPFAVHPPPTDEAGAGAELCALVLLPPRHHLLLRFRAHADGVRVRLATDAAASAPTVPHAHQYLRQLAAAAARASEVS